MGNNIDLSKCNVRTDLVIENIFDNKVLKEIDRKKYGNAEVSTILVDDNLAHTIGMKKGMYVTIEFEDVTNFEDRENVGECFTLYLKKVMDFCKIKLGDECLVVGLGNRNSTPDSLGAKVVDRVLVTRHLFLLDSFVKEGMRVLSAVAPGVMADSGIETSDIISCLVERVKPKFLLVIDALASSSIERVNRTIQITDTGINPGSGVGNYRKEISKKTMGIPVIAIGVPTVVDSATIVSDTITYLFKHLSYIKNNYYENKLVFSHSKNYLNKIQGIDLSLDEKRKLSGIIGELSEGEKRRLINEVLTSVNYNLIVTPKEIDFLIDKLSEVIAGGINNAMHESVSHY